MAYWNSPFHNPPTFTDKGLFPVCSVVTTRKDLTGIDAEIHNHRIGEQYIVDKYNQYGVMYLLNLDGTSCKWQLGGGSTAKCFEPVLEWQQVPVESLTSLKVGDKIKIGDEENEVCGRNQWGFSTLSPFRDVSGTNLKYYANNLHVRPDTSIPVYKQVPKMVDLIQLKQTTLGETTMKTTFTKADLKTGMRVTTTSGRVWTVLKDVPPQTLGGEGEDEGILVYDHGWMDIKGLDENFVYTTDKHYSLIKVEQVTLYCNYLSTSCDTIVLWEREAPKSKEQSAYDEAVEATEAARQAYELAQKKLEALNPSNK